MFDNHSFISSTMVTRLKSNRSIQNFVVQTCAVSSIRPTFVMKTKKSFNPYQISKYPPRAKPISTLGSLQQLEQWSPEKEAEIKEKRNTFANCPEHLEFLQNHRVG